MNTGLPAIIERAALYGVSALSFSEYPGDERNILDLRKHERFAKPFGELRRSHEVRRCSWFTQ